MCSTFKPLFKLFKSVNVLVRKHMSCYNACPVSTCSTKHVAKTISAALFCIRNTCQQFVKPLKNVVLQV